MNMLDCLGQKNPSTLRGKVYCTFMSQEMLISCVLLKYQLHLKCVFLKLLRKKKKKNETVIIKGLI